MTTTTTTTIRDALLEAATDLVDAGGPQAVTLREVGRRAGVSHNAPYRHFADKQSLLAAAAARELAEYALILSTEKDLSTVMRVYIDRALSLPARYRLVYGPWTVENVELSEGADAAWAALLLAVNRAQVAGELPSGSASRLANLLRSVTHGAIDLALVGHLGKGDEPTTPGQIVDALVSGLRQGSPGPHIWE